MFPWLTIPLLVICFFLADVRPATAWVMMHVLPKGEVPEPLCTKPLASALKKVPPIRGEAVDGFGHYSCTLYYRGTHDNVQELLDALAKIENLTLRIDIDRSGNVGKLVSRKIFPMKRPMPYLYRVSISWNQLVDAGTLTPSPHPASVALTIHSAGGIKPDKLELPKNAVGLEKFLPAKKAAAG